MMDFDADIDEDPKGGPTNGSANDQPGSGVEKVGDTQASSNSGAQLSSNDNGPNVKQAASVGQVI